MGPATVEEIAARLGSRFEVSRFDVLARDGFVWPRRHRALRTTVGWSHELCTPLERLLWARLTVFRGAFDPAAARDVAEGGPLRAADITAALERLAAQSVLRREGGRYRMPDTLREYGQEWLRELGEETALADRHARYLLELARRAEAAWSTGDQVHCYRQVDDVHADLRTALDHLPADDPPDRFALNGSRPTGR